MQRILVVEDDEMLNGGLCYNLDAEGFATVPVYTLTEARKNVLEQEWQLIILDVNLPDGDGFSFFQEIRKNNHTPVVFLTACDMDSDILKGFMLGADDYITKPFNIKILIQKIKAVLRRCSPTEQNIFSCGNLSINFSERKMEKNGISLLLTPTEYKLLYVFVSNSKQILTRDTLIEALWSVDGDFIEEHALTIQISRLRAKIKDSQYSYIKTIYGLGYQWIGEKQS